METKVVPLGVKNIKTLAKQLKALARDLGDEHGDVVIDIEQDTAGLVAEMVRSNIAGIPDKDGNYLGTDNPNASVVVRPALRGHAVVWSGQQIAFVEFGTGAKGAAGGYPSPAIGEANYHPDPTKQMWAYKDKKTGKAELSVGLAPQAPMYHAAIAGREALRFVGAKRLKEALHDAVTV
jgi:hypothetical protein